MNLLERVASNLLLPGNLDFDKQAKLLGLAHERKIDYADFYFQDSHNEHWVIEDGIIKEGSFHIEKGVGVRAIDGEKTGFAYADEINEQSLRNSVLAARSITEVSAQQKPNIRQNRVTTEQFYQTESPLTSMDSATKVAFLKQVDGYARSLDSRIVQLVASLSGIYEEVLVQASDGTIAADIRPLVRFSCSVVLEENGKRERGGSGGGGRTGYEIFLESDEHGNPRAFQYVNEAIRQAQVNLTAVDAPAGEMPVVLGNGWTGVLLHEAVGHGLEGDFNRKESSNFSGKLGQQVASKGVTIVDDGTIEGRRGSLSIDDEGTPTQCTTLIEDGVLVGYMQDKMNARLMGQASTGNGRRESYAHLPMPRMTNTYMLSGKDSVENMIASVPKGIYAVNFGGGQVDITSGKFVFSCTEAYLIENGQIGPAVKGATLIGNGPQSMQQISMIGDDSALDNGVGVCGKDGQSVPVGVGQPSVKIDKMTVGGTSS